MFIILYPLTNYKTFFAKIRGKLQRYAVSVCPALPACPAARCQPVSPAAPFLSRSRVDPTRPFVLACAVLSQASCAFGSVRPFFSLPFSPCAPRPPFRRAQPPSTICAPNASPLTFQAPRRQNARRRLLESILPVERARMSSKAKRSFLPCFGQLSVLASGGVGKPLKPHSPRLSRPTQRVSTPRTVRTCPRTYRCSPCV